MLTYITVQPAGGKIVDYIGSEDEGTMISEKAILSKPGEPEMMFNFDEMETSNHTGGGSGRRVPPRRKLSKTKSTDSELSLTIDELGGPSNHASVGRVPRRRLSKSTECSELSLTIDDFGLDASSHHVPRRMQHHLSDLVEGPSGFVMSDSQLMASNASFSLSCWDANSNDDGKPPLPRRKNSNDSIPQRGLEREYSIELAGDGGGGSLERGGSRRSAWRSMEKNGSDFSLDMSGMEPRDRRSNIHRFPSNFSDLDSIDEYSIPDDENDSTKSPEELVEVTTWAFVNGKKRKVRFDPRDEIHEVESPDPEEFSVLYYGVHELQSMMDDMRMEEKMANEKRRNLERLKAARGLSSTD